MLTENFSISQSALAPNLAIATDSSTGSDGTIVARRIFVQDSEGNYLVPTGVTTDYTPWPIADLTISLDILTEDIGAAVTVQWLNSSDAVVYTKSRNYSLSEYNKQFFYYLAQQLGLQPGIAQDSILDSNMASFWTYVNGANNAVTVGDDIAASQNLLNKATNMRNNQTKFF